MNFKHELEEQIKQCNEHIAHADDKMKQYAVWSTDFHYWKGWHAAYVNNKNGLKAMQKKLHP